MHNLAREGITSRLQLVGDAIYELLREHAATAPKASLLARLGLRPGAYVLATVHRAENTEDVA